MNINDELTSPLHLKLIKFFHENQASLDTPRGVATWIREDRVKVKEALEDLVALNILIAQRSTSTTGYSYSRNKSLISRISRFLKRNKSA